jgi:hypothetical protein
MASTLNGLADQLASSAQIAGDGSAAGDPALAAAISDFGTNWSDKRGQLADQLKGLATDASEAVMAYEDTDHQLAKSLHSGGKGKA